MAKFPLLDRLLYLPFLKNQYGQFSFDLRTIKITGGAVDFQDYSMEKTPAITHLRDLSLDLERLRGRNMREFLKKLVRKQANGREGAVEFSLTTTLERDRQQAKFEAAGTMILPDNNLQFDNVHWHVRTRLGDAPASLIQALAGGRLRAKSMSGTADSQLQVEGDPRHRLQIKGVIKFRSLAVEAPEVFFAPLSLGDGQLVLDLDWQPGRTEFSNLQFTSGDLQVSARGALRTTAAGPAQIRLSALAPSLNVAALKKYLPLKWLASAKIDNLLASLQEGEIDVQRLVLAASLNELRQVSLQNLSDRFGFEAELRNLTAKPAHGYLPLRMVHGRITFEKGLLSFKNLTGSYGQSRLDGVDGTYRPQSQGQGPLDLRARGEFELVELRELLKSDTVPAQAVKLAESVHDLAGRAKFELSLERGAMAALQVEGKLTLDGARLRVENYSLTDVKGDLTFTPHEIRAEKARALFNGAPVQGRVSVTNYTTDDGFFDLQVESNEMKAGVITTLFQFKAALTDPGTVRGWVRYQGPLASREGRRFTGNLDLANVQLQLQPLLQPLRDLSGTIKFDETGIDFHNLKALLAGVPASANGRWRFGQKTPLFFDFAAPNMDLQYLLTQIDPESTDFYANLEAVGKINIAHGRYKSFEFSDLKTDVVLDHRVWKLTRLGLNAGGGTLQGTATPVGARYSPNTSRRHWPHSPVVTPAWAQAIEAGMTLRPSLAAALSSASAAADGRRVARGAVRLQALDLLGLGPGVDGEEAAVLAGGERRGCGLGVAVDADHLLRAAGDGADADGGALDQPALHVAGLDRGQRPAHRRRCGPARRAPRPSAPRPCRPRPWSRRTGRGTRAGRSRRPGSAACAGTIAGPRGAAGPAPRSRPGAGRRGRGRSSRA